MRSRVLSMLAIAFALPVAATLVGKSGPGFITQFAAFAEPAALMRGCSDVPEAVALANTLQERASRVGKYLETLEERKAELARAEAALTKKAGELKKHRDALRNQSNGKSAVVQSDIDRLVAVYDQMKPAEAAAILTNLPSDFAAEILMRVTPENGARIIAAVEPEQAALLTAEMGARSVRTP